MVTEKQAPAAPPASPVSLPKVGLLSAALLVVANMIGSGIFTTSGFMAGFITQESVLLFTWLVGGLLALCGALSYGELAAAMPRSGGEYHYLSKLYHPAVGFLSGFISLIVGFGAAIAGAALIFGKFGVLIAGVGDTPLADLGEVWSLRPSQLVAILLVALLTWMHSHDMRKGAAMQNVFTILKVLLVLVFIIAGLGFMDNVRSFDLIPSGHDWDILGSTAFGTCLAFVYFAYSGWNAAAYISGEVRNPSRNVPLALLTATLAVTVLYMLINYVFLLALSPADLAGKEEFAGLVANRIFGDAGGRIMSGLIAFALISSTSSMVMAGPRVTASMGEDFSFFRALARKGPSGTPRVALLLQLAVASLIILYGNVGVILNYIGLTLSIFAALAVGGVFILRARYGKPAGYRIPLYPLPTILFLLLSGWLIVWSVYDFGPKGGFKSTVPLISGITLLAGYAVYLLARRHDRKRAEH
ncbi:MAG: amino acid permease [Bacteroidetes bacterium]|nr:amino acid permease [Bacteroidota bacterium]